MIMEEFLKNKTTVSIIIGLLALGCFGAFYTSYENQRQFRIIQENQAIIKGIEIELRDIKLNDIESDKISYKQFNEQHDKTHKKLDEIKALLEKRDK